MSKSRMMVAVLLGGAALVGCKKEEKPATPPPAIVPASGTMPSPTVTVPATPAVPSAPATAPSTSVLPVPPAVTSTPAPATPAVPSLNVPHPTTLPSLPTDSNALTTTTPSTGASATDAKNLLEDAAKNIADKKWDAAGDDFKKLNAMKGQLTPELQAAITEAEAKFVAAKAGSGLKLPGLGGSTPDAAPETNK